MTTSEKDAEPHKTDIETIKLPGLDVVIVEELTHRRDAEKTKLVHEISEKTESGKIERAEQEREAAHKRYKDKVTFFLGAVVVAVVLSMSVYLLVVQSDKDSREVGSKMLLTLVGVFVGYMAGKKG